jgi:hypothetical protein
MLPITIFHQNFAVTESLLQLYGLLEGLARFYPHPDIRLALCQCLAIPQHEAFHVAQNDRLHVISRAAAPLPEAMLRPNGLDFLLRQAVVVACGALDSYFNDIVRNSILTVVRARKRRAHEALRKLTLTLEEYLSLASYEDEDFRLQQIILKNFERKTLSNANAIGEVAAILAVDDFWHELGRETGEAPAEMRRRIDEIAGRRNDIAHRADRAAPEGPADGQGLQPITHAWVNQRVQTIRTVVVGANAIFMRSLQRLEDELRREQEAQGLMPEPLAG